MNLASQRPSKEEKEVEKDVTQTQMELSEMKMSTFDHFVSIETVDSTNELSDTNFQKVNGNPEGSRESHSGNLKLENKRDGLLEFSVGHVFHIKDASFKYKEYKDKSSFICRFMPI